MTRKLLPLLVVCAVVLGCASSRDLQVTTQILDMKITAQEKELQAVRKEMEEIRKTFGTMEEATRNAQRSQADIGADMTALRTEVQKLRGSVEETREALASGKAGGMPPDAAARIEDLTLRIQYMENFLGIGKPGAPAAAPARETGTVSAPAAEKQDAEKGYNEAYEAFKAGKYSEARNLFEKFLAAHGDSDYGDNAQFWIGETYFFEKDYERAILEYEKVIKNYPQGNKVPNALLKQGLSFLELGDKESAKLLLNRVVGEYPNTSPARIAKIKLSSIQ